jgi:hypothetical protein
MGITPIHPNLLLERPMTRLEMIDALRYEGMFGYKPMDSRLAHELEAEGLAELKKLHGHHPVIINCMDDPSRP